MAKSQPTWFEKLSRRVMLEAARKARDESRNGKKSKKDKGLLSGKLTPAQSKNPKKNELYLVEGDSAGGSAKQGRDRKFQAILPLRGKVLNTAKAKMSDIVKNEEINTMIYTIGAGVGAEFNVDNSNYDKIIIMTDADTDGAHIQTLLLTFFTVICALWLRQATFISLCHRFTKCQKARAKRGSGLCLDRW